MREIKTTQKAEIIDELGIASCSGPNRRHFLVGAAAAAIGITAKPAFAETVAQNPISPLREILKRNEPAIWVFAGDSITHGAKHTLGWRSYSEHFAERLRSELPRVRDIVVNTGVSGDTVPGVLADLNWRVLQFKPAVVSLMFGMNDCIHGVDNREAFRRAYLSLVEKVRAAGALPLLNTTNTILGGRDDVAAYNEIIRAVAVATKTPIIDHYAYWLKERPTVEKLQSWIADGTIHPGVHGHRAIANLIFRELGIFDPMSPTCNLETP